VHLKRVVQRIGGHLHEVTVATRQAAHPSVLLLFGVPQCRHCAGVSGCRAAARAMGLKWRKVFGNLREMESAALEAVQGR